jgi:hypothetical protein
MGSEDFLLLAGIQRRRRFEKPCNGAETNPKAKKTAVRQHPHTIATGLMEML